jgi:cell wall integrity and stress response component
MPYTIHSHPLTQISGGGDGFWSVYFTNTDINYSGGGGSSGAAASSASSASSSSAAAAKSSAASSSSGAAPATTSATTASSASDKATVITSIAPGKTVIITQAPASQATPSASAEKSKGGSNTAGIAAGVVVGIVVIAAESHQQLNDYSSSQKSPMTFRSTTGPDSRIDPDAMASRRMSDGSIADNEDYSRRILKVR